MVGMGDFLVGWRGWMGAAFCRGGYGALRAFSMSAFARWFAVHPVQAFVWLHAHRLPRLRLRVCPAMLRVALASALAAAAALPAGTPPRVLGGSAGSGCRFRHGSWTSVRFSAGDVRRWLCRPGETPTLGGVSGRFGLRNRPEVASGVRVR